MKVGDRCFVISGRYAGYSGGVIGGDKAKGYVTVNVHGIHALRFAPENLRRDA